MAGKLIFTPEEYQQAAIKYREELLMLPIIGCQDTLKFMTARPGIRYKENVGEINASAQFAPYKANRTGNTDLQLDYRTLETFFGNCVTKFEPNSAISTLLGIGQTKGDGQMQTPSAKHVLALISRSLSENLNNAIWTGRRNPSGDTTQELFNGFDTITELEMAKGNISAAKGNYMKIPVPTDANAEDIAKAIMRNLDPRLRAMEVNFYCSQDFLDSYNECYQNNHGALPYNQKYEQQAIEGSGGRIHFVPLFNKADSKFIHVSPRTNMLVGYDQMGDIENVSIEKYDPFLLTYVATMFFGCQFESIDKRRLMVAEIDASVTNVGTPNGSASNNSSNNSSSSNNSQNNGQGQQQAPVKYTMTFNFNSGAPQTAQYAEGETIVYPNNTVGYQWPNGKPATMPGNNTSVTEEVDANYDPGV